MTRSPAETTIGQSRAQLRNLYLETRTTASRIRALSFDATASKGRSWQQCASEFAGYCHEMDRLLTNYAERIYTHERTVLNQLETLAQTARENDQ